MELTKIVRLVDKLFEKTKNNDLKWEVTEKETEFQVGFPESVIRISKEKKSKKSYNSYDTNPDIPYEGVIKIFNENGTLIEEITPMTYVGLDSEYMEWRVIDLYEMARRQALNVESEIDKILNTLENGFHV